MTLSVDGSLNTNTAIVSGPGPPNLIRMCRSCAIPGISVRGWVGASSLPFLSAESANLVLLDRSKLFETLKVFLILFHMHFLETKAPKRLPVRRLVWVFVVRMYRRRISHDKIHTIFNNSKLNINVYTSYIPPPRVYVEVCISFRLSDFPFILSYVR